MPLRRPGALALLVVLGLIGACDGASREPTTTTAEVATTTTTIPVTTPVTTTTTPDPALERLARSVLMVGIPGTTLDAATERHLARGGRAVILLSNNIDDAATLTVLTADISCAAGGPALVAVDQEFSPRVRRLEGGMVSNLPSPQEALALDVEEVREAGRRLGTELLNFGITVNLAPVIDVVRGPNPVLEGRHLGSDPEIVAAIGTAFLEGMAGAGVVGVPKHFPGHGLSTTDPHDGSTVIEATLDELADVDWLPFEAALQAGTQAVMVGHPVYTSLDPDRPASLSPAVLDLLRDRFGFDGVAVTDALGMEAVAAGRTSGGPATPALQAGEDLLLIEDPAAVEATVIAIERAVASGELPLGRLQEASARVNALADSVPEFCSN